VLSQPKLPPRYRLVEEVGQGGMAVVYRAVDDKLGRPVAVKLLHSHLLSESESKARLQREAQAVAKLQHPNIVQIYDSSGSDSDSAFIVAEFVEGQTLRAFLSENSFPIPELAALVVLEVGAAVAHAHTRGILHRDIKPENVMVRTDGAIKLTDFGVAQVMDMERMTVTGQLIGSPAYMAPELIDGRRVDVRTDIFSLGVMLYQMATGEMPFVGRNPHEVFKRIADGNFPDPRARNALVGRRLHSAIRRALATDPADRYPDMAPFLIDLQRAADEVGLHGREPLKRFFAEPTSFLENRKPHLVEALVGAAKSARGRKQEAAALDLLNRACTLAPEDTRVTAELERLRGSRALRRRLGIAGSTVGLLAALLWIVLALDSTEPERTKHEGPITETRPAQPIRAQNGSSPPGATTNSERDSNPTSDKTRWPVQAADNSSHSVPSSGAQSTTPAERPKAVQPAVKAKHKASHASPADATGTKSLKKRLKDRGTDVRPAPSTPEQTTAPEETHQLVVAPSPLMVEVYLDGQKVMTTGTGDNALPVSLDRDREYVFRNDSCCWPETRTLGPGRALPRDDRLVVRLSGKPAAVTVVTQPPRPEALPVLLESGDWAANTRLGRRANVPFGEPGILRKEVVATVYTSSGPVSRTVRVRAGASAEIVVDAP